MNIKIFAEIALLIIQLIICMKKYHEMHTLVIFPL
jgi:hypothetical protein